MPRKTLLVTQSGADTFTSSAIATGLTVDGRVGWEIVGIEAFWVDGAAVAAADYSLSASIQTISTVVSYESDDEIVRVSWGLQNTAGVAVAIPYEPVKTRDLAFPRVTVQPNIYCCVLSAGTSQANDVSFHVYYNVVKLTELEVLRLVAGGA